MSQEFITTWGDPREDFKRLKVEPKCIHSGKWFGETLSVYELTEDELDIMCVDMVDQIEWEDYNGCPTGEWKDCGWQEVHINRDKTFDCIGNLRIVDNGQHVREDHIRVRLVEVECISCGKVMERKPNQLRRNAKLGRAGPFCRSCAGKYGQKLQVGAIEKLEAQSSVESEYYWPIKSQ